MAAQTSTTEDIIPEPEWPYSWLSPFSSRAVHTEDHSPSLLHSPLGPFLFPNTSSDARDHCANERTFLSWLRLSIFMAVVSVAVVMTFHLKNEPTELEKRYALPFGLVFWVLSLACLGNGLGNYLGTIKGYARRVALVQSGWVTQLVFMLVACSIVAACILLLSTNRR